MRRGRTCSASSVTNRTKLYFCRLATQMLGDVREQCGCKCIWKTTLTPPPKVYTEILVLGSTKGCGVFVAGV